MDLVHLFSFQVSPAELILRGTLMYWFLFVLFRFVLRRDVGAVGIADVLLVVLIADASQNAMGGGYDTVAEGCVLVATLAGWNYLLDWASFRWEAVRRLAEPAPLLLIDRGRVLGRNLRRELVTRAELDEQLRLHGLTSTSSVRAAYMEVDGSFSVAILIKAWSCRITAFRWSARTAKCTEPCATSTWEQCRLMMASSPTSSRLL